MEQLLERMILTVVSESHMPLEEVRQWSWRRLHAAYIDAGRRHYDAFLEDVQAAQIGTARAIAVNFGAKDLPELPEYEGADPFAEQAEPAEAPGLWDAYLRANNLER